MQPKKIWLSCGGANFRLKSRGLEHEHVGNRSWLALKLTYPDPIAPQIGPVTIFTKPIYFYPQDELFLGKWIEFHSLFIKSARQKIL